MTSYAMFTDAGDQLVADIAARAVELSKTQTDDATWQYAYSRLELLSRTPEFAEATDTEVRESLWTALCQTGAIQDQNTVQYWFYVDWLTLGQTGYEDQFQQLVDHHDQTQP